MRALLCVVVLSVVVLQVSSSLSRQKRFLFDTCDKDADCGKDRCCIKYIGVCAPRRGIEESCNFKDYHGCGCKEGLFCQVAKCFASYKYYQCLPAV